MDPIEELLEFDRENVTAAKAVEERIQQEGLAAGHTINDVRLYRVLMPWVGTKRWDGSAEGFTFAEFETDKGLIGIAEGANSDLDELRAKVLGKNPFDTSIRAEMGLAYWDLSGKIADRPLGRHLHELFALDTPLAARVPMSAYTWYRFPDITGAQCTPGGGAGRRYSCRPTRLLGRGAGAAFYARGRRLPYRVDRRTCRWPF